MAKVTKRSMEAERHITHLLATWDTAPQEAKERHLDNLCDDLAVVQLCGKLAQRHYDRALAIINDKNGSRA